MEIKAMEREISGKFNGGATWCVWKMTTVALTSCHGVAIEEEIPAS